MGKTSKTKWRVFPSEKAAERARREGFAQSSEAVWLGEICFSLPHFLKKIAGDSKAVISRRVQKHLLMFCLRQHPLRHFEKLRRHPLLVETFEPAIRQLKKMGTSPQQLETLLQEAGSLREFDLLKTYERYEALKKELGVLDEEDLFEAAKKKFPPSNEVVFENFLELPPALRHFIKIPPQEDAEPTHRAKVFSLPSPHQEIFWFLQKLGGWLQDGADLSEIGILTGSNPTYYEPLWEKLREAGVVQGESPFLSWLERPQGRRALKEAARLEYKEAPLKQWLEGWLETVVSGPFLEFAQGLLFGEHLLSLGPLSKKEWLFWLRAALKEKPNKKISSQLEGLQWLDLSEGDFPKLKFLWAPGLIEGQFPSLNPLLFNIPGFEDEGTLFAKKRRAFLKILSQISNEVCLTTPRLNSLGKDLAASPLLWDFPAPQIFPSGAPPLFEGDIAALQQKLRIEGEHQNDTPLTPLYHTQIPPGAPALDVQKTDYCFSPTQLEAYAQCPFKFFARRVLGIPQIREQAPDIDAPDKGTLFHNCLETLLSQEGELFREAQHDSQKEKILYQKLETIARETFEKLWPQMNYAHPELYRRWREKTVALGQEMLAMELREGRELASPMKAAHFEWAFGTATSAPLKIAGKEPILLGGRVDRIDVDAQNRRFLILDYKTGNVESLKNKFQEGLSLQLPVYTRAVHELLLKDHEPAGGLLITVKKAEKTAGMVDRRVNEIYFSLGKKSQALLEPEEFQKLIEKTFAHIREYVEKIRAGVFTAAPKDCRVTCDYKEICRYAHKPLD